MSRALITGMGMVSPVGATLEATFQALRAGRSGLARNEAVDFGALRGGRVWAPIPAPILQAVGGGGGAPLAMIMARAALDEALADARLDARCPPTIAYTSTQGSSAAMVGGTASDFADAVRHARALGSRASDADRVAYFGAHGLPNGVRLEATGAWTVARRLGCTVLPLGVEATCATGLRVIVEAARAVALGEVEVAIVLALSTRMTPYFIGSYNQLGALSRFDGPPELACRPFDRHRSGMVVGEAAVALVIESDAHAARTGAPRSHGSLRSWAFTTGGSHPTAPEGPLIERTLTQALARAGVGPEDLDGICTHGTSTQLNDRLEAQALRSIVGEARLEHLAVSALKGSLGHSSIAAGAVETALTLRAMRDGVVLPTPSCLEPDPALRVPLATTERQRPQRLVMKNSFGFGGQYGCAVLARD